MLNIIIIPFIFILLYTGISGVLEIVYFNKEKYAEQIKAIGERNYKIVFCCVMIYYWISFIIITWLIYFN